MVRQLAREYVTNFVNNIRNPHIQATIEENFADDSETIPFALRTMQKSPCHRPFEQPLSSRAYAFLTHRVHNSKSRTQVGKMMSFNSLLSLRWDFLWLILDNAANADSDYWTPLSYRWCKGLQRRYNLPSMPMDRMIFGIHEIRLLIEETLTNPLCYENALQHCCGMLIHFLFGARPSSLYVTPPYKTFLKLKAIRLRRGARRGHFDVEFILNRFKGYSENQITVVYTIRPPTLHRNVFMYLAGLIIVLGIRRGDFLDFRTLPELLDGEGPRGQSVTMVPMSSGGARAHFHKVAINVGIDGSGETTMGAAPYSFRSGFATTLVKAAGLRVAAGAMGHRAGSTTISESYDDGNRRLDFFGLATGEGNAENLQSGRTAAVYRAPVDVPPLNLAGIVERQPIIAVLLKQAQNLQSCLEHGGGEGWQHLVVSYTLSAPFQFTNLPQYDQNLIEEEDTPVTILKWTLSRIKRLSARTRARYAKEFREDAARRKHSTITAAERRQRAADLEEPSRLTEILKAARLKMIEARLPNIGTRDGTDLDMDEDEEIDDDVEVPPISVAEPDVGDVDDEGAEDNSPAAVDKEMIGLMTNLVALEETKPDALYCDECREDSTCTPTDIARDWKFQVQLDRHQKTFHSAKNRSRRFLVAAHALGEDPDSGRIIWRCPWCGQEEAEDLDDTLGEVKYFSKAYLIRHIVEDHAEEDVGKEDFAVLQELYDADGGKALSVRVRKEKPDASLVDGSDDESDGLICDQCRADPSLPDARRVKPFPSMAAKKAHLKAILHQPEARAIRMLKKDCSSGRRVSSDCFPCPYCSNIDVVDLDADHFDILLHVCQHIVDYHPDISPDVLDIYEEIVNLAVAVAPSFLSEGAVMLDVFNNLVEYPETEDTNWAAKEAAAWGGDSWAAKEEAARGGDNALPAESQARGDNNWAATKAAAWGGDNALLAESQAWGDNTWAATKAVSRDEDIVMEDV
ncbi:hypothetical protein B0H14DRAFT_3862985 [Mycena olivaceomarginata]|nr:hypothetical protein B0H14DRAFT_3862985 [Mycena olivaceomarginata]